MQISCRRLYFLMEIKFANFTIIKNYVSSHCCMFYKRERIVNNRFTCDEFKFCDYTSNSLVIRFLGNHVLKLIIRSYQIFLNIKKHRKLVTVCAYFNGILQHLINV